VRAGAGDGGEVRGSRRTARDAVARAEEGSKEGNKAGIGERTTCGRRRCRTWSGGSRAAARGGSAPVVGETEQGSMCPWKKKRGKVVRGTCLEIP
jgi:hypothetical protein